MPISISKKNLYSGLVASIIFFVLYQVLGVKSWILDIYSIILLSILPGFLIASIFFNKIVKEKESIVYLIGFSISYLIFLGLGINSFLPIIGISKPLTFLPILISISASLLFLIGILYRIDKNDNPRVINFGKVKDYLYLIPLAGLLLLSVVGATSLNNNGSNIWAMTMLLGTAVYVLYRILKNPNKTDASYGISIFVIALSVILMVSLRGIHVGGWDIHEEFEVFQVTKNFGHWSISNIRSDYNTCLSITILPTVLSSLLSMSDEYIYKLICQAYFALVPVIMYFLFRKFTTKSVAFLAVFYYIAQPFFVQPFPALVRQEIGFIFFGLFLLTLYSSVTKTQREIMLFIFGISMIVAHYSTTYVALGLLLITYLAIFVLSRLNLMKEKMNTETVKIISLRIIVILSVLTLVWYSSIGHTSNSLYGTLRDSLQNISHTFTGDLKSTDVSQSLSIFSSANSNTTQEDINEYLDPEVKNLNSSEYYPASSYASYDPKPIEEKTVKPVVNTFINGYILKVFDIIKTLTKLAVILGTVFFVFKYLKTKEYELLIMMLAASTGVVLLMVLPELSIKYNLTRFYMQSLMLISLPAIVVGLRFCNLISKKRGYAILTFAIIAYFLYVSGFVTNIFGGKAYMQVNNFGDDYEKFYTFDQEAVAAKWLGVNRDKSIPIYTDEVSNLRLVSFGFINNAKVGVIPKSMERDSYVYARYENIYRKRTDVTYKDEHIIFFSYPWQFLDENKNLVYNNGGSKIFR